MTDEREIDETDREIIEQLQRDRDDPAPRSRRP